MASAFALAPPMAWEFALATELAPLPWAVAEEVAMLLERESGPSIRFVPNDPDLLAL